MKKKLSEVLRCPGCGGKFSFDVFKAAGDEIIEGILSCPCPKIFPIINSIPRILPDAFYDNPDFVARYRDKLPIPPDEGGIKSGDVEKFKKLHGGTKKSFGRQWLSYNVKRQEEDRATFIAKTGFNLDELKGKRVLDAGCGGGRYTLITGGAGAEVYAVDISASVEKTAQLTKHLSNVNVIQADLFNLLFEKNFFDYIYSIGVLDHTPDTRAAFEGLPGFLKPGGAIAIWLYMKMHPVQEIANRIERAFTKRLSFDTLHRISVFIEPYGAILSKLYDSPRKWARRLAAILNLLAVGVSTHPDRDIRICDTFDWYSPEYQWHHTDEEVRGWFENAHLMNITNLSKMHSPFYKGQGKGVNFSGVK